MTVDCSDEQVAKVQATVLAACSTLANLLSHMEEQGLKGQQGELIPTTDVAWVSKDTLALLGNAVSYISQVRRTWFIDSINLQQPTVAKFLHEVTKEGTCSRGTELFKPEVHKRITDRADTIDA